MKSRFLFYLGHPAHYHNFKHCIAMLETRGHQIKVVARGKDVLFGLLAKEVWDIVKIPERKAKGKAGLVLSILKRELAMLRIAWSFKPHVMIGTDLVITHVGTVLGIKSIVVNEDDSAAVPLMAKYAFPYATAILAPNCCDQSPANHKKIGYEGYHELAYLHPDVFKPSGDGLPEKFKSEEPFFILRFASLHAHHDAGKRGISDRLALKLIAMLSPKGKVYITSERQLTKALEPLRISVHPALMHEVLARAAMYIGDSQTMAAEAAVLGVPSIRFNDFVGQLSYLEELEHRYGLTVGIKIKDEALLISTVKKVLSDQDIRQKWQAKRQKMLDATISVTPFWVQVFEEITHKKR